MNGNLVEAFRLVVLPVNMWIMGPLCTCPPKMPLIGDLNGLTRAGKGLLCTRFWSNRCDIFLRPTTKGTILLGPVAGETLGMLQLDYPLLLYLTTPWAGL